MALPNHDLQQRNIYRTKYKKIVKKAISQEFLTRQTCFQSEHFEKKHEID